MPRSFFSVFAVTLAGCAAAPSAPATTSSPLASASAAPSSALDAMRSDARAVAPLVSSELARRFLAATAGLPHVEPRTLYRSADRKRVLTKGAWSSLGEAERAGWKPVELDEEAFYSTNYGSPLSYVRALDVLAAHRLAPSAPAKLFDFGYGYVGHLRLLASLGFDTIGVDVDPLLAALYSSPGDQGRVSGWDGAASGSVRLLDGAFPADAKLTADVGAGHALVLSKNVLKRGYIHPDRPADERSLIRLGVTDDAFLRAVHDALAPRGVFLVYNICPALSPPDKPFVPWSDGRFPFSRDALASAGFEVVEFDRDDTPAIRALGHALSWDRGEDAMDLERDLSVLYTLAVRRD